MLPQRQLLRGGAQAQPRVVWDGTNEERYRDLFGQTGGVAFVGGIGIADQWARDTERGARWRDTQIELRGPAAVYVEGAFNENWIESGEVVERSWSGARPRAGPTR